jgi:spermidine synthase
MGATLPAMARRIESTPHGVSWLGFFYGGNIAGAVFGCLLAGFYLLRVHDSFFATFAAAAINGAVALAAIALSISRRFEIREELEASPLADKKIPDEILDAKKFPWPVYVTIALSGLTAIGAEVVWTRLLSLTLGGTVYAFSIILAVFLFRAWHWQRSGRGARAEKFAARNFARLVPVFFDGGDFLDGLYARGIAAVLAD